MGNAVVKFFPTLSSFLETNDNQIMKWYLPYSPQWHYCNSTCSPQVKYVQSSHSLLVWQVMEEQSQQPELFVAAGQEVPKFVVVVIQIFQELCRMQNEFSYGNLDKAIWFVLAMVCILIS
jgi:hypothetical protein